MKIYWGGADSGKGHLVKYARLNSKTFIQWKDYQIIKRSNNCKETGYDVNDRMWWSIDEQFSVYHKRRDEDNIRVSKYNEDKVCPVFAACNEKNYCNQDYGHEVEIKWDDRKLFRPEQYKKYMGKEYIDTAIYNSMVTTNSIGHTCESLTHHKDKLDLDEITNGVDLMFLFQHTERDCESDMRYYADKFRDHEHIIPYKENMVDSIATKLDKVGHLGYHLCGQDMMHLYKHRKDELWEYLDRFIRNINDMKQMLDELKIPYTMFNLDKDDYVSTFGWENHPFDNKMTHLHDTFHKPIHWRRWRHCIEIAEEYLRG